ncbi:hypothetical protein Patl1_07681 [Pistacia atlantica]|uniref:Uncharacterized protein n=1 Tax=Pistacia atlantica TaxID=434234 RepID=A0ACC1AHX0_9ROSI|nr:hypothetical protein Patl1_07681 [Pistacia atlantica]
MTGLPTILFGVNQIKKMGMKLGGGVVSNKEKRKRGRYVSETYDVFQGKLEKGPVVRIDQKAASSSGLREEKPISLSVPNTPKALKAKLVHKIAPGQSADLTHGLWKTRYDASLHLSLSEAVVIYKCS